MIQNLEKFQVLKDLIIIFRLVLEVGQESTGSATGYINFKDQESIALARIRKQFQRARDSSN